MGGISIFRCSGARLNQAFFVPSQGCRPVWDLRLCCHFTYSGGDGVASRSVHQRSDHGCCGSDANSEVVLECMPFRHCWVFSMNCLSCACDRADASGHAHCCSTGPVRAQMIARTPAARVEADILASDFVARWTGTGGTVSRDPVPAAVGWWANCCSSNSMRPHGLH